MSRDYRKEVDLRFHGEGRSGTFIPGEPDEEGLVDLKLTEGYDCARQDMYNRIRTQKTDWRSHPEIGGDLELLEGEPNTRDTAARGVEQIMNTLIYDGRFAQGDLYIRGIPMTIYQLKFLSMLQAQEEQIIQENDLNL